MTGHLLKAPAATPDINLHDHGEGGMGEWNGSVGIRTNFDCQVIMQVSYQRLEVPGSAIEEKPEPQSDTDFSRFYAGKLTKIQQKVLPESGVGIAQSWGCVFFTVFFLALIRESAQRIDISSKKKHAAGHPIAVLADRQHLLSLSRSPKSCIKM